MSYGDLPFNTFVLSLKCNFQEEDALTSSSVLPIIIGLSKTLEKKTLCYCTSVRTGLIVSVERRFESIRNEPHFIVSTVLDPRNKLKWTDDPTEKVNAKSLVMQRMQQGSSQSLNDNTYESASGSASSTDDELLSYMVKDGAERPSGDNELDSYLGDISAGISAGSTLQFWEQNRSKYSGLFILHQQHHCVPATSAAVESCFSEAGNNASARRNRLSDSMLENMLVARCNMDLLKN